MEDTRGIALASILMVAVLVAGIVVTVTVHSLLGPLLIVGGTLGLGWSAFIVGVDRIAVFLSTGTWRREG